MKSLFKTVSLVLFFTILTRAAGFLLRIFLSREIGAEQLGIYQISLSIFVVLATAVSSGLPLVISRLTAKYIATNDKQSQKRMLGCALIIAGTGAIIITLLCFIFQNAFAFVFADDRSLLVFIVMLPALIFGAIDGVFKGSQWGKNNYLYVCIVDFFEQISRIILCVLLLNVLFITLDGAVSAGIALCISCMLSMIFSIILFFSKKGKIGKPVNHYAELIKGTAPITGMRLASSLMTPIISIILPLRLMSAGFTNSQAMSLMGVAFGMTLPLLFIPSTLVGALTMALVPDLACAKAKNENKYIDNRISSSIVFTLMGCIIFIPLFMGAGELIGQFLFANMQSGVLLSQSAWLMLPLGMVNLTAGILNSLGLEF
ncbi:MAG: oligosaccharide flippase family protein, partial [Clostridia bacterium]